MGYQGMLIEMAKEYVVLATSQSQSLMCGGQMSCNKHAMDSWAQVEPQIVWNRSAGLSVPQASPVNPERQHYVTVGQLLEKTSESAKHQPQLPPRNSEHQQDCPKEAGLSREESIRIAPSVAEKPSAKEAAAKGSKKRFRIFRAVRSVIKSRFRK